MNGIDDILNFWFGEDFENLDDSTVAGRQSKLWWGKDAEVDTDMQHLFEARVQAAGDRQLDDWARSAPGRLALILWTDQFTRNIHRDTPAMFGLDGLARTLCVEGLEAATDASLRPIQRVFFYLPLEHSENADDQAWCVDLMHGLAREVPEHQRQTFESFVDYARAHQRIIDRFGRFPHRNAILGRESTAQEIEFLKQPGSSF